MRNLIIKEFNGNQIYTFMWKGKICWIANQIVSLFDYADTSKTIQDCILAEEFETSIEYDTLKGEELKAFKKLVGKVTTSEVVTSLKYVPKLTIFYEDGLYGFLQYTDKPVGVKFRKWVRREVIPEIRETGTYSIANSNTKEISVPYMQQLEGCKFIADDLNVNEASKLFMYQKICESNGVNTTFLPKYELNGSRQLKSATQLLKESNIKISTVKFNRKLIELGYVEERQRKSTKGNGIKKFKALTDNGLRYGENAISPHNQKEVQPLYYADTFLELARLVGEAI